MMVDRKLYEELARKDPEDVILHPWCTYDNTEQCYTLTVWKERYAIYPHAAKIVVSGGVDELHEYFQVFLINYLLLKKSTTPTGTWVSVKDLPGGVTFFRGPHEVPTGCITQSYGDELSLLDNRCRSLGGVALDMADCSYGFDIVAGVRVALLYWRGDEDFDAEASILLDESIKDMPLDVVYALLCAFCYRLGETS